MYNDPNCKPWTSHKWAPPGYTSRFDLVEQKKAAQARNPLESGAHDEKQIEHAGIHGNGQQPTNGTAKTGRGDGGDVGGGGGRPRGEKDGFLTDVTVGNEGVERGVRIPGTGLAGAGASGGPLGTEVGAGYTPGTSTKSPNLPTVAPST